MITATNDQGDPSYATIHNAFDVDSDIAKISLERNAYAGGRYAFHYKYDQDLSGKITGNYVTDGSWRYSPNGNKTETYSSTNKLDQYGSVNLGEGAGNQTYSYDANGNVTSDGSGRTYTYNSESQLIRAAGTGPQGVFDMEYWYDGLNRRSHSIDHQNGTETFHKHSGEMETVDYAVTRDGAGKAINYVAISRVAIGNGVDNRLAYQDVSTNSLTFPLTNHQGSTVMMTNEDGRALSLAAGGRFIYDPYGNDVSGAAVTGYPYRYTGRRYDAQTGLYYYRARYYDPKIGRFLQTDPIGTEDQMNLYAYVHNDPLSTIDPNGEKSIFGPGGVFDLECIFLNNCREEPSEDNPDGDDQRPKGPGSVVEQTDKVVATTAAAFAAPPVAGGCVLASALPAPEGGSTQVGVGGSSPAIPVAVGSKFGIFNNGSGGHGFFATDTLSVSTTKVGGGGTYIFGTVKATPTVTSSGSTSTSTSVSIPKVGSVSVNKNSATGKVAFPPNAKIPSIGAPVNPVFSTSNTSTFDCPSSNAE